MDLHLYLKCHSSTGIFLTFFVLKGRFSSVKRKHWKEIGRKFCFFIFLIFFGLCSQAAILKYSQKHFIAKSLGNFPRKISQFFEKTIHKNISDWLPYYEAATESFSLKVTVSTFNRKVEDNLNFLQNLWQSLWRSSFVAKLQT